MVTEVKPVQPSKAPYPIEVTELGIVIVVNSVQRLKISFSICVMEFGKLIDDKLVHPSNAHSPIETTELGIVIEVKLRHE